MAYLHIANTDMEMEFTDPMPLEKGLRRNSIVHQLQYLPLLYADDMDGVGVTDLPSDGSRCYQLSSKSFPFNEVLSWGPSKAVAEWAKDHGMIYQMPPWELVREVNSKAFSFAQGKKLPNAELIFTMHDLEKWIEKNDGLKVLKTCFGLSGQGHFLLPAPLDRVRVFAAREFQAGRPLIAEPWVQRKLDFSTQWFIEKNQSIEYLGSTLIASDAKGRYAGNIVGSEEKIFGAYFSQLQLQKEVAHEVLVQMGAMGFFGNVGFDAMIWGENHMHPIVEINARKTMGFVALQIQKRLFSNQTIQVSYTAESRPHPLLPQEIDGVKFKRNLYATPLAL